MRTKREPYSFACLPIGAVHWWTDPQTGNEWLAVKVDQYVRRVFALCKDHKGHYHITWDAIMGTSEHCTVDAEVNA